MPPMNQIARFSALPLLIFFVFLATPATAANPPKPIVLPLLGGQSIEVHQDPIKIKITTATGGGLFKGVKDISLDLGLLKCSSTVAGDGVIECSIPKKVATPSIPTPSVPTPDAGVPAEQPTPAQPPGPADGPVPEAAGDPTVPAEEQPVAAAPETQSIPPTDDKPSNVWKPIEHVNEVLTLGVSAFALLALVGTRGVAAAKRYPPSKEKKEGSVTIAEGKSYEFDAEAGGWGDRSGLWRLITGWLLIDRFSRMLPLSLARRAPLCARILADGSYLRAILGMFWIALPLACAALGWFAARDSGGYPLAPALGLTAALLLIAIFDATAGLVGVLAFGIGVLVNGPGDLGFAPGLRSFMGIAALWFAIPLLASVARPLRRTPEPTARYSWDRLADSVVAALIAGWAVQGAVGGLPGLSGRDLPITEHADLLALFTIAAILARVLVEEIAARFFPERLKVVEPGMLPEPAARRQWIAAALRTAVFVFIAYAFVGPCWQLWVGTALFALPQLMGVRADALSKSALLGRILPRGLFATLFMIIVGSLFAKLVVSIVTEPADMLRNGFVLLALPGFVMSLLGLFGDDPPDYQWSWPRELLGAGVVALSVGLVFVGF